MAARGKVLKTRNGCAIFELVEPDFDGEMAVVGYVVTGPGGKEVGRYSLSEFDRAISVFERLAEDNEPDSPSPGM